MSACLFCSICLNAFQRGPVSLQRSASPSEATPAYDHPRFPLYPDWIAKGILSSIHYLWRPMLHDPGDEMVLEAAVNGGADAIVTFNTRHYGAIPGTFNIEVLRPSSAIRRVRNE